MSKESTSWVETTQKHRGTIDFDERDLEPTLDFNGWPSDPFRALYTKWYLKSYQRDNWLVVAKRS